MNFLFFLLFCLLALGVIFFLCYLKYCRSAYFRCTKLPYTKMRNDAGRYGEFLVYKYLRDFERDGAKFLFNVYIPKKNGETSEIDVLMLCKKGIFVVESKNYSGWIFGRDDQKMWYQTLPTGYKRSCKQEFYNPVMQNYHHIKHLRAYIGEGVPMWSIIAFSDRCELKSIRLKNKYIPVINRYDIEEVVEKIWMRKNDVLTDEAVEALYQKLFPLTQIDEETKKIHIQNIKKTIGESTELENDSEIIDQTYVEEKSDVIVLSEIEKILASGDLEKVETVSENSTEIEESAQDEAENFQPEEKAEESELKICPRCQKPLVLRTANKGENKGKQFYGCSGYPKCRFIENKNE